MFWRLMVLPACLAMIVSTAALAQDEGRGERGERRGEFQRGGEGRGGWDPQQMRERMSQMMKEQLHVNDEEWKVLEPKIERVTRARVATQAGGLGAMFGGRGGPGGPGGRDGGREGEGEVASAARELRTVLQNENASPQEINERLSAYRAAREKANQELESARNELKELLTPRQEAVLALYGLVE